MVVQSFPWLVAIPLMFSCFYINFNGIIKNASSINHDILQLDEKVSYDLFGMPRFHMIGQKVLLLESFGQLGIDNDILSIGFLHALMFLIVFIPYIWILTSIAVKRLHYLELRLKVTTDKSSFVSVISKVVVWFAVTLDDITQSAHQGSIRLISQLTSSTLRVLQKSFKHFNGTFISIFFKPLSPVWFIFSLNLNKSVVL